MSLHAICILLVFSRGGAGSIMLQISLMYKIHGVQFLIVEMLGCVGAMYLIDDVNHVCFFFKYLITVFLSFIPYYSTADSFIQNTDFSRKTYSGNTYGKYMFFFFFFFFFFFKFKQYRIRNHVSLRKLAFAI